jgi:broad specificity phosphatase PhoE
MSTSMKTLVFMRHGETTLSRDGNRFCGELEPDITPLGQEQAARARETLASIAVHPDALWVSPRLRAQQTAHIVLPSADWQIVDDLRELAFGAWEGLMKEEAQKLTPEAYADWEADSYHNAPPHGESGLAARTRIDRVLKAIDDSAAQTILIVSHITFLRLLVGLLIDIPPALIRKRLDVQTGKLGVIEVTEMRCKLKALNL